jgi:hypothetical protein
MNQGGYLLIAVTTWILLVVIVVFTLLDIFRTRKRRMQTVRLLKRAEEEFIKAKQSQRPNVEEMQILREVIHQNEIRDRS